MTAQSNLRGEMGKLHSPLSQYAIQELRGWHWEA